MSKKLVIHIGTHKTGSTAIQLFLWRNRDELLKNGITYPESGAPSFSRFGQHLIAWSCFSNADYIPAYDGNTIELNSLQTSKFISKIDNATSNNQTVVISSEEFSILNLSEISVLAKQLSNFDVTIVVYLRRQDMYLESAYGTSVQYNPGYVKNFSDFCVEQRMNLNYMSMIESWEYYFPGKLVVKSYEDKKIKQDIVSDFMSVLNVNIESLHFEAKVRDNKSISAHATEVVRCLRLRGWSEEELKKLRHKLSDVYSNYSKKQLGRFLNEANYNIIWHKYSDCNRMLLEKYNCDILFDQYDSNSSQVKNFDESFLKVFRDVILK